MSERVTMPALGESVTEGTVTRWLKAVGERVEVDEPLLEVSTDKVDTEIPSPVAGVLEEILVQEDDTVPVGADLAVIGDGSGGGDQEQAPAAEEEPAEAPADNSGQSGDGDAGVAGCFFALAHVGIALPTTSAPAGSARERQKLRRVNECGSPATTSWDAAARVWCVPRYPPPCWG